MAVEPGLDEKREVELRHVCLDEQGSCPRPLGGTAGTRQGDGELGGPVRITQSNSHIRPIGSRGPEEDYRSGWTGLSVRTVPSWDPSGSVVAATATEPRLWRRS